MPAVCPFRFGRPSADPRNPAPFFDVDQEIDNQFDGRGDNTRGVGGKGTRFGFERDDSRDYLGPHNQGRLAELNWIRISSVTRSTGGVTEEDLSISCRSGAVSLDQATRSI